MGVLFGLARVQPARAIVVGEAPSPNWRGDPDALLASRAFRRVAALVFPGASDVEAAWAEWLLSLDRCNVLSRTVCRSMAWRADVRAEAEASAREIVERAAGRRLYLLGQRTADAFGYGDAQLGTILFGGRVVVLPYPSGRSHWWNDAERVALLAQTTRALGPPTLT